MHTSYLTEFFDAMNKVFPNQWCVLHSYETLPNYSESDVDMAFSGHSAALESLIFTIAKKTGWTVYQKLWYDVETCFYYVLKEDNSDVFLALDFLMDNDGVGRYAFTTKFLTHQCTLYKDLFPIPNPEVAFCYKLAKRIEKQRSLEEDRDYLKKHYQDSDTDKINAFLVQQFGPSGKEMVTDYLKGKAGLSRHGLKLLKRERRKRTSNTLLRIKCVYWEIKRIGNRIFHPRGVQITLPYLDNLERKEFMELLEKKVDILFRFVKINDTPSMKQSFMAMSGSTLLINHKSKFNGKNAVRYHWLSSYSLNLNQLTFQRGNVEKLVGIYYDTILMGLLSKLSKKDRI